MAEQTQKKSDVVNECQKRHGAGDKIFQVYIDGDSSDQ
jgi:hypothetical protein